MKRGELEDMVRKGYRMYFLSKYRIPPHLEILEHEKLKGVIFVKNIVIKKENNGPSRTSNFL
jgi:hypothetical protein